MGNCPSEFAHVPGGIGCIIECPAEKGFEMIVSPGKAGYSCAYSKDPNISFPIKVAPNYNNSQNYADPPTSYINLPNKTVYEDIIKDFNDNLAIAVSKIDKQERVNTAFEKLQEAENVRDQAPDSYEKARVAYYTLTKGDTWLDDEKQRVSDTEAGPVVKRYLDSFLDVADRSKQQQQTIDAITNVKDNVLSVADDMRFSVAAFEKQLTEIKNRMEVDKKKKTLEAASISSWLDLIMNILIALVTCVAIFFVARAVINRVRSSTPITPPTT
jgi:hypothetical protein